MNKKGQFRLLIGLFVAVMIVVAFIALLPLFSTAVDMGMSSASGLNCASASDYNATKGESSSIGCLGLRMYIPLIVLVVLIAIISYILYGDNRPQQQQMYG